MKPKLKPIYVVLSFLVMISLACGLGGKSGNTGKETPTTKAGITKDLLGEEFRNEIGGFTVKKVKSYNFNETFGIVNMQEPGADEKVGPAISVIGGLNDYDSTNDQLIEKLKQDSGGYSLTEAKKINVSGKSGLAVEIDGKENDKVIKGRIVVVMVTPKHQFMMVGVAPAERWSEIIPVFEDVQKSVTFFEINPDAAATALAQPLPTEEATANSPTDTPDATQKPGGSQLIRQWASSATASSQYGNQDWAASQTIGEPDVETCGDNVKAWASFNSDSAEWIELTYATPVVPSEINVYQSYNPSQVVGIQMIATTGEEYNVWSGVPETVENCPDVMSISLELTKSVLVNKIKIMIDQSMLQAGWDEIDAVELVRYGLAGPDAVAPTKTTAPEGGAPVNTGNYPYTPESLSAGAFVFDVAGADEDTSVKSSKLQNQSTSAEYVVGLISQDDRYALSLFLPLSLKEGTIKLAAYNDAADTKNPSAAIYIRMMWLYVADGGELVITKDPSNGKLSGVFRFTAFNKDDPAKKIEVVGAMNQIPLKK